MGKLRDVGLFRLSLIIFLVFTITTCFGEGNLTTGCFAKERLALLKFKHSVIDYGNKLSSWVGSDCCRWAGVRCDSTTGHVVTLCLNRNYWGVVFYHAEFDDYTDAHFSNNIDFQEYNNLKGDKVNSALAELRHLNHFDLSGNDFQSSRIPEFIGSLKHLRYLNLSYSNFGGMIPYNLGNLSNLIVLDLGSNYLLAVDDISWVSGLLSLKYLDLSEVKFSQTRILNKLIYMVPSLIELHLSRCFLIDACNHFETSQLNSSSMLHNIKHLYLSWNFLQEPFPNFLRNMTSLLSLDLSNYDLSQPHSFEKLCNIIPTVTELYLTDCQLQNMHMSPIHANLSRHSKLQLLDLRRNLFKGEVTVSFMNMSSLSSLDLSDNFINSYVLPVPGLVTLDLSYNKIDQIGISGMWKQCHLKQLRVDHNHIQGEMIGSSSTNMSHCSKYALASLDLSWNQFNGSIPKSIEKLTSLETLYLNSNQLTGCIPSSLGKLIALKSLSLEWNKLNGSVPESLGRLASLQMFSVSSNELSGTLPSSMGKLTKLKYFDVSNNSLEDVVTEHNFASLSMLKYLYATPNPKLTFNFSHKWIPLFQLRRIRMSSCKIVGEFPSWIRTQKHLEQLEMSNSSIFGRLPTWMRNMSIIPWLDLSHNQLSGPLTNIPCSKPLWPVYDGGSLFLNNNLFNGPIPESVCKWTHLEVLDLSKNMLSGQIPRCLQNIQYLKAMVFNSNKLSGLIPSFRGNMTSKLTWLNLNNNSLRGELPVSLGNFVQLRVLDLGNNNLSGSIPKWIGERFSYLVILRLHKNYLTGRIPESLCRKSNLNILDIAHNNIKGVIPRCFKDLRGMIRGSNEIVSNFSFQSNLYILQVMKGLALEYTTNLQSVINMDLSSNKLFGEIPKELTTLSMLVGLNFSHNNLNGCIPNSIGNMKALFSLDFSENELTGMIPSSMSELNFLSYLNLSHNNLSGQIPTGNQLRTLNDPSIYAGNRYLCGAPLQNNCSNGITTRKADYKAVVEPKKVWFYLDIVCGFATGFWGLIGVLLFKKQWRYKLFMLAEFTMDKMYVVVAVRVSKMKRGRQVA